MSGLPDKTQAYANLIETLATALARIKELEAENQRLTDHLTRPHGGDEVHVGLEEDSLDGDADDSGPLQSSPSLNSLRF